MSKARELADVIGTQDTTENVLQGRRNLIINGAMQVAQRGTSGLGSTTATAYTLDRWFAYRGSVSQQLDSTTGKYALRWTYSSSNDSTGNFISQNIEDINCMHTRGQNVTLSFQVRVNANTWGATDFGYDIIQDTTANRSPNAITQSISTKVAATTSWQTVTKTVAVNTNTTNICITFGRSGATNVNGDWFEIRDVQLEVGSVATPFEHRSYGEELALCQRYYQSIDLNGVAASRNSYWGDYVVWIPFVQKMRVDPTITSPSVGNYQPGGGSGTVSVRANSNYGALINTGSPNTNTAYIPNFINAHAYLKCDSEL